MAEHIIDIEALHNELNLTNHQVKVLSDAFEKIMADYNERYIYPDRNNDSNMFFEGTINGINNCYKIVNKINDDYNMKD